MTTHTITDTVGPFRSELAAKMHLETFMVAQRPHNHDLAATVTQDATGWFVNTSRTPKETLA
jgi:hypothetical protein